MMLKRLRNFLRRRGTKSPFEDPSAPTAVSVEKGPSVVHRPIDRSDLDIDAVKIVQRLTRFDHRAYLVGGCVRDLLLDQRPKDFDVGTSATPRQIKRLFRNSRIIGRRFRLAHIYFQNGKIIEVATFRAHDVTDGETDGRGSKDILIRDDNEFGTPAEDALRRDFTINALFYDVQAETVIDHADGLSDLRRRLVRTIGDPHRRFREDPIRILRAIKFAARLDMTIEPRTLKALEETRSEIPKAAAPRILEEINRFCRSGKARRSFEMLRETGVLEILLPELKAAYADDEKWKLLADLLDRLDRRYREGVEATTGEILALLLLPALRERLGWAAGAPPELPKGTDVRQIVDEPLRPMALRLRLARRDQEECRQILTTLSRLAPLRRLRRGAKLSILRRASFPRALDMLATLAAREGGDFERALDFWKQAGPPPEARRKKNEPQPAGRERSRRRRRPAGPRKSSGGRRPAPGPPPGVPVDENYFFNALPTVPDLQSDDTRDDRYGAAELAARSGAEDDPPSETGETGETAQTDEKRPAARRRKRRRGSRGGRGRRRRRSEGGSDGGSDGGSGGGSGGGESE